MIVGWWLNSLLGSLLAWESLSKPDLLAFMFPVFDMECVCVCLPHGYIYVWKPEESAGSPEAGIQAVMILGTGLKSSGRAPEC